MRQLRHMWRCWNDNEYYHWYVCFLGNFVQLLFRYHYHEKRLLKHKRLVKQINSIDRLQRQINGFVEDFTFTPITNKKARVRIRVKPRYKIGMSKVEKKNLCLKLGLSPYNWRGRNFVYPSDGGYR